MTSDNAFSAAGIARGECSAFDFCSHARDRVQALEAWNIFISLNQGLAAQARLIDDARVRGEFMGPLAGAPLAIKDNIDTHDLATTAGTPGLAGWRPAVDAPLLGRLRAAGGLVMGKANMQELALGITSNNAAFGAVRNPAAPDLIAGGSSGGTAAAIAAGLVPAGLGTDTAGSIRIPAALCGVAGFRPSMGRYSQHGVVPLSHSRDTIGPMAARMEDIVLLDQVITGARVSPPPIADGLRLGVPSSWFWDDLDHELEPVVSAGMDRLEAAGCILLETEVNEVVEIARLIGRTLTFYECVRDLDRYLTGSGMDARHVIDRIASPDVAASYALAMHTPVSTDAYVHARTVLQPRLRAAYSRIFMSQCIDALVFPATPLPARPIGQDATVALNGRQVDTRSTYLRNTEHAALAGLPSLVLPAGRTASGLPVGLELDGQANGDGPLLAIGRVLEPILAT